MQSLFLTPSAAWLALLAGPLVLFYFLKLKRPQLQVPSLVLWRQVLADQRVNSPFQRFKRSLMLLLQLLMLLLLVTAAMQPVLRRAPEPAERLPVLIDCSASMAALDRAGGVSRLQAAKATVGTMIESLLPGQKLCLISFAGSARRLTGFTDNKRVLHAALDAIQVDQVAGDLDGALRLAQALSRTEPLSRALLLSDGVFPATANVELPFTLEYQRLDPAADNLGITSLNARRAASGDWSLFISIEGRSEVEQIATIELSHDGETMIREHLTVAAAVSERLVVTVPGSTQGTVTVRLQPVGFDSLDADNLAFLELVPARPQRVLVSADLHSFRRALAVLPEVELVDEIADPGFACDLVICDDESLLAAAGAEAVAALTVGLVPGDIGAAISIDDGGAQVVDWQRGAMFLQHVQLDDLVIVDRPVAAAGFDEASLERLGYEVLVHGADGPLLLQREQDQRVAYHMLFDPERSTLPYRIGFPILIANIVHEAAQRAGLNERRPVRTGILPPLALSPDKEYLVTGPDGTTVHGRTGSSGELIGMPASRVGRYLVTDSRDQRPVKEVAASLLDRNESRLVVVDEIDLAELSVAAAATPVETDRPLWPVLALLALGIALGEWWLFHRRPGRSGER
jgi:hypothetical protein